MKAFVEKYEQNADGKIGIIEVRKLCYGIKIRFFLTDQMPGTSNFVWQAQTAVFRLQN